MSGQMARDGRIVNLDEHREDQRLGGRPPEWLLDDRRAWLIVPLIHLERLAGFLLLERSPVVADLNWEDFDLLRTVGQPAASYIVEAQSQSALADAEKCEEFTPRSAIITHEMTESGSPVNPACATRQRSAHNTAVQAATVRAQPSHR